MKTAQELRVGNVVMVGSDPLLVQKAENNKSGRNSAVVKLKLKKLLTGSGSESTVASSACSITEITSGGNDALAKSFMAMGGEKGSGCRCAALGDDIGSRSSLRVYP